MTGLRQQASICNFMKMINQYPIVGDNHKKETETLTIKKAGGSISNMEYTQETFEIGTVCFICRFGSFHSHPMLLKLQESEMRSLELCWRAQVKSS